MSPISRLLLACSSAALVGAAGLGSETLLLSTAGLALGYGRSTALGLAVWIAAWALGARFGGGVLQRLARPGASASEPVAEAKVKRLFLALSLSTALISPAALALSLHAGSAGYAAWMAGALSLLAIACVAFLQGPFLPLLLHGLERHGDGTRAVNWLFAANLLGSVAGARWIGFEAAGQYGCVSAAWVAGGVILIAGVVGYPLLRGGAFPTSAETPAAAKVATRLLAAPLSATQAGLLLALGTAWLATAEWISLRIGVLWLGGMQPALTAVLSASLLALAIGAACLPALLPRGREGVAVLFVIAAIAGLWPHWAPAALALVGPGASQLWRACVLVGPLLLPLGALVPVLYRAVAEAGAGSATESRGGALLGTLLLYEALGAIVGLPLAHWWLMPHLGTSGSLTVLMAAGVVAALGSGGLRGKRRLVLLLPGALLLWSARQPSPVMASPQLANPAFNHLALIEDAHFTVTVVDDAIRSERTLLTDDFRATAVGDDYLYMRVLGHLPLLCHPEPKRVAVLAFGTGTTAGAVSLHSDVERIEVLEISRAVLDCAPYFEAVNHGVLDDERVVVRLGDGRRTLASESGSYDVLTMEPLLPDSPFAVYLYTAEFYAHARRSLAPGGLLCQWVPPHALEPETFEVVVDAFARSFPWTGIFLFGTQVILLGGEEEPSLEEQRFARLAETQPDGQPSAALLAVRELGLDRAAGVMARWVTSGADWPRHARPLVDADPWVIYRPRRAGVQRLGDLPRNLALLRKRESEPPTAWRISVGADAAELLDGVRLLHRAREAWHRFDAARQGLALDPALDLLEVEDYRTLLAQRIPEDPERQQFERQLNFDHSRTGGVAALVARNWEVALKRLMDAIDLRPERADLHLFMAVGLQGRGAARAAERALARARKLCPRVLETPQGLVALRLGLRVAP